MVMWLALEQGAQLMTDGVAERHVQNLQYSGILEEDVE